MKSVLIVGNLYALAKRLSAICENVFVVSGNAAIAEFAKCVDIREDNPADILNFVLENNIDLTVVASSLAIKSDIATVFQEHNTPIFAPAAKSALPMTSLSATKKFLYKLHVPTPKFAVFEKLPLACEYLDNSDYPLVISNDANTIKQCCTNVVIAKRFVEELFFQNENKVIIEDYVYGKEFSVYAATDGYHALPFATTSNFKFTECGDGGILTSGVGAYVPNCSLSKDILDEILNSVIINAIKYLEDNGNSYLGIMGIDGVLTNFGDYYITAIKPFIKDFDSQAILNQLDENLIDLFDACANGLFADEYEDILQNDNISVSCLISSRQEGKTINNLDMVDSDISYLSSKEPISFIGNNFVLTSCAKTLSRAKEILSEDIELIKFDGMKCRSDIYN